MIKRLFILIILILFISPVSSLASVQQGKPTLTALLRKYSAETGVRLSYSATLTDAVSPKNRDIIGNGESALKRILQGTGFECKRVGKGYIIIKGKEKPKEPKKVAEVPKKIKKDVAAIKPKVEKVTTLPAVSSPDLLSYYPFYGHKDVVKPDYIYMPREHKDTLVMPHLVAKTNLLYDATLSISAGMELLLNKRYTLDLSAAYNAWSYSDNKKMRLLFVQPELRRWNSHAFAGSFWAMHLHSGVFNWGGMLPFGITPPLSLKNYRYQGWLAGAGIGYGYHWILGRRFSLEAEIGVGYTYLGYEKYPCKKCGKKIANEHKNYIGPTKAALSLIYNIK